MFKNVLTLITIAYLVSASSVSAENKIKEKRGWDHVISLINLIATPEKYHNKEVCTIGLLDFSEEDGHGMIFTNEYTYEHLMSKNSKGIFYKDKKQAKLMKKLNGKLIYVCGTYDDMKLMAHGILRGAVVNVSQLEEWTTKRGGPK